MPTTPIPPSVRSLARAPAFVAIAVAVLALGIGLSTAVFTVADGVLLRGLPIRDEQAVLALWGEKRDGSIANWPLTLSQERAFARNTRSLQGVAYTAYEGAWPIVIRDGNSVMRLRRALVSGNYFSVLGVPPAAGRLLRETDDVVGAAPVAVISYGLWQRMFGGDSLVVGRSISAEEFGLAYRIVGVAAEGLEYPKGTDFWAPFVPARLSSANDTSAYTAVDLVGRLAPGATPSAARNELTAFFAHTEASITARELRGVEHPLARVIVGDMRPALFGFAIAAALLLAITCTNVATLLLVRGLARAREMAVRSALGASRARIIAQLLLENILLALLGGAAGIGVAAAAVKMFLMFAPPGIPLLERIRPNATAFVGALAITGAAMLLSGLAPAVASSRADLDEILRAARQSAPRSARVAREALVSLQVALAMMVLCAAALVGRSFLNLQRANLEIDASHLVIAELAVHYDQYPTADRQASLIRALVAAIQNAPGVDGVSPVVAVPFSGTGGWTGRARTEEQSAEQAAKNPMFNMEVVTPDYFKTFGLRVVRGRAFTADDRKGSELVIVVSQGLATRYWPGQDPIGKRLYGGAGPNDVLRVVGVVPDTRYRDLRDALPSVYFAFAQNTFAFAPTTLAIRAAGDPRALLPALRKIVDETVPGVTLASAAPFETYMRQPLAQPKLTAMLLAIFAVAAAALAGIGLFGTTATMARLRTREIGIRMTLGATASEIRGMVLRRGGAIIGAGLGVGMVGALATNRLLASLTYGVDSADPVTIISAGVFLGLIALVATLGPAHSSARLDPASVLRAGTD